jgi:hypothetical protein
VIWWKILSAGFVALVCMVCSVDKAPADEFKVTSSLGLKQEYNDNLFFDDSDEEEEFITTISTGLELGERTERLNARLKAEVDGLLYAQNDELNDVDQLYRGDVDYRLTPRTDVAVEAEFRRDSRPDRDLLETGLVLGTTTRERQRYRLSSSHAFSERTSGSLSYLYERDDYDDPEVTDVESHDASLGFSRDVSDLISSTVLNTNLGYSRYRFSDSRVEKYTWTFGASRALSELFGAHLAVGVRHTRSKFTVRRLVAYPPFFFPILTEEENKSNAWGGLGQLGISYNGEVSNADVTLFRDITTASGRSGTTERTALTFTYGRRFSYELWGYLSGGYYLNEGDAEELATRDIDERTVRINPRLRYSINRDLALEASYSYTRIQDDAYDTDSDRNLVFLRLVFRYPWQQF